MFIKESWAKDEHGEKHRTYKIVKIYRDKISKSPRLK